MGSVKDLTILKPAYENKSGVARFTFSDRYSVFDWGEMPDHIVNKGRALAVMAAFNFEKLQDAGIRTHYEGLVTPKSKLIRFSDIKEGDNGSDVMEVSTAVVYRPTPRVFSNGTTEVKYDYSLYDRNRGALNNYLLPLEIIFRNGLPEGSSVFKRIEEAKRRESPSERELAIKDIVGGLGLKAVPKPGDMLPKPVMNYTTKLESGDRNLSNIEAFEISGLTHDYFSRVAPVALRVNDMISKQAEKTGFVHYDGKVEMLWRNDYPVVCDVAGTFDEDRFGFKGEQVSKEFLRQWYKKNQPGFSEACDNWKKTGEGWQQRCGIKPIKLDPKLAELVSQMYMAGCNQYVEKEIFDAPDLKKVMDKIRPFR
jgi:phosphoribosylaminoimidazole-succinocarboxamide synthase